MAEAKGLMKPVKLKIELAELLGAAELPRTKITKKLWDYIKANKLQTKTENGKPGNAGKFIVADDSLLPIFKNTKFPETTDKDILPGFQSPFNDFQQGFDHFERLVLWIAVLFRNRFDNMGFREGHR